MKMKIEIIRCLNFQHQFVIAASKKFFLASFTNELRWKRRKYIYQQFRKKTTVKNECSKDFILKY